MKVYKDGNTILKFNESRAVTNKEEIKAILDDVVEGAQRSIIAAEAIKKSKGTA